MNRLTSLKRCALLLAVAITAHAQAPAAIEPAANTWSARSASGIVLAGTFTVVADSATGTVTGTWTLNGTNERVLASGAWSAAKANGAWSGAWRSIVSGSTRENAGTWTANLPHTRGAILSQLFERNLQEIVRGTWRSVGNSGAWSIRLHDRA